MVGAERLKRVKTSEIRELLKLATQPGMVSFAGGLPASDCFDVNGLTEAAAHALADKRCRALQYSVTDGDPEFVEAVSEHLQSVGTLSKPHPMLITSGSQQAIDLTARALLNPGDVVLVESPTYLAALQTLSLAEASIQSVKAYSHGGIDLEDLESKVERLKPKMLYLVPTYSNPSGHCLSREQRLRILELAQRYRFWVLEDDPYRELYFEGAPPPPLFELSTTTGVGTNECIYMSGLSKVVAPGLRLGWVLAPASILPKLVVVKQAADLQAPSMSQRMVAEYLRRGMLASHLPSVRSTYSRRAASMDAALRSELGGELEYSTPKGGMFFWARLAKPVYGNLLEQAIARKVLYVPGESFFADSPPSGWMRLSFATSDETTIRDGVGRLAAALRDTRNLRE